LSSLTHASSIGCSDMAITNDEDAAIDEAWRKKPVFRIAVFDKRDQFHPERGLPEDILLRMDGDGGCLRSAASEDRCVYGILPDDLGYIERLIGCLCEREDTVFQINECNGYWHITATSGDSAQGESDIGMAIGIVRITYGDGDPEGESDEARRLAKRVLSGIKKIFSAHGMRILRQYMLYGPSSSCICAHEDYMLRHLFIIRRDDLHIDRIESRRGNEYYCVMKIHPGNRNGLGFAETMGVGLGSNPSSAAYPVRASLGKDAAAEVILNSQI
jgi:hypothetical protein